jgi:CDP-glucose 4,6-dehydratase
VEINTAFWSGKRVFITGHTGFKGSWLALWLKSLGAEVTGFALAPSTFPSLYDALNLNSKITSVIGDICDAKHLESEMRNARPEIVLHLAAQSLVRLSYDDPVGTFTTNAIGTVNVLEAMRKSAGVRVGVIVSSDKCYENQEWSWGYRESDPLGGHDPYSASKALTEIITSSYRRSFLAPAGIAIGSGRAGNVIGGGDWCLDRLVPDLIRGYSAGMEPNIRHPHSVRPWQHVLEPLSGYLILAERLWSDPVRYAGAWNFGPSPQDTRTVGELAERFSLIWGGNSTWTAIPQVNAPHEATLLRLDNSKALNLLNWSPTWNFDIAVKRTAEWYRDFYRDQTEETAVRLTLMDIARFAGEGSSDVVS